MRSGNEEIFVSVIVVRRPERADTVTTDPAEWAQSVVDSLRTQEPQNHVGFRQAGSVFGSEPGSAIRRAQPQSAYSQRYNHSLRPVPQWQRTWMFVISAACFIGAAYCFYLAT